MFGLTNYFILILNHLKVPKHSLQCRFLRYPHLFGTNSFQSFLHRIFLQMHDLSNISLRKLHFHHTAIPQILLIQCRILILQTFCKIQEDTVGILEYNFPVLKNSTFSKASFSRICASLSLASDKSFSACSFSISRYFNNSC